jgi:hypothetical protein
MTGFLFGLGLGVLGVFLWMMRTHASLRALVSDRHLEALVAAWQDVCQGAPAVTFLGVGLSRQGARLHATLARGVPTVGLPWVAAVVAELAALPSPEGGLLVETHGRRALSLAAPDTLPPAPIDLSRLREAAANRMKSMRLTASR